VNGHLREVREVADEVGAGFLGLGFSPKWSLEETPIMPKDRYNIMKAYMPKVGTFGPSDDVPLLHGADQSRFQLSEADMVKKMRVSLALQPIATALFANSPFKRRQAQRLSHPIAPMCGPTPTITAPATAALRLRRGLWL
jgi:glutamate--cysteine ligase